jgi:GMP synthase PP-ATPase subunit
MLGKKKKTELFNVSCKCDPRVADSIAKQMRQEKLTPENVQDQFCSDWLKEQIRNLFSQLDASKVEARVTRECYDDIREVSNTRKTIADQYQSELFEARKKLAEYAAQPWYQTLQTVLEQNGRLRQQIERILGGIKVLIDQPNGESNAVSPR